MKHASDSPGQMGLPGLEGPPGIFKLDVVDNGRRVASGYTLLLALVPEEPDAQRAYACGERERRELGLTGSLISRGRLHVTLFELGSYREQVPQTDVDAARVAAGTVATASSPMHLVFDQATSYPNSGVGDKEAFALECSAPGAEAIRRLRASLSVALRRHGLKPLPSSTPHMTMLYDRRRVAAHPIEPLEWTACRVVLIVSHVGLTHHQWVDQWALAGS